MFEQYGKLAKEQYPDFNFTGWEIQAVMKKIHGFEEGSYDDYRVYVYRIWDIDKQCELSPYETDVICQRLGFLQVPRLFVGKVFKMFPTLQDFLTASEIPSINAKQAEGLVYKSIENINGKQIHFKVINNKYLLKQD